jgi:nucleotidyltransferase/DNA polymerase involved in DNA repair
MKRQLRKLPDSIDLKKVEEIFSDRLAELIVMTLDYQQEQKLKAKTVEELKVKHKGKKLTSLENIGKTTATKLEQIGIMTADEFLARDPYDVFNELVKKVDPTLCKCALANLVGAQENRPWHKVVEEAVKGFQKKYPYHQWKDNC